MPPKKKARAETAGPVDPNHVSHRNESATKTYPYQVRHQDYDLTWRDWLPELIEATVWRHRQCPVTRSLVPDAKGNLCELFAVEIDSGPAAGSSSSST